MQKEYVTVKIDKRVVEIYKEHCSKLGTVLTWRQLLTELLIREAGYLNTPLPPTQSTTQSPVPQAIPASPVPVQATYAHPWEDPDWRPDGWVVLPFDQWVVSKDGIQAQEIIDYANKNRKERGLGPDSATLNDLYHQQYVDMLHMARAAAREAWESEQEEQQHAA